MNVQVEADLASGAAPELLVPGDVAGYLLVAQTLRGHARLLRGTGDCLSRIEVTNWRGQASTGFLHVIAIEPGRWRTAADAFTAAAVALEGFLASLTPAREQARQARTLYQQYQTLLATAGALAGVPSALPGPAPTDAVMSVQDRMRIGARYQQMTAIAAGGALRGPAVPAAPDPVATVYAADTMRRQAITLLEQARRTVDAAGSLAADALAKAMEQAPAARRLTQATIRPAAITDTGHTALDTAGLLPGVGELADAANSLWYLSEGDTPNAAISAAGTLPLLGNTVVGGRLVYKGTKLGKRAAKAYDGFRGPQSGTGWLRTHEIDGSHTSPNTKARRTNSSRTASAATPSFEPRRASRQPTMRNGSPRPSLPPSNRKSTRGWPRVPTDPGTSRWTWGSWWEGGSKVVRRPSAI